jgi:hypothetical protein
MSIRTIFSTAIKRFKSALLGRVSRIFKRRHAFDGASPIAPINLPSAKPMVIDHQAEPQSQRMKDIDAEHDAILDLVEETGRLGHVPADALIGQLYANLCDRLSEIKRQKGGAEEALDVLLRRLDSRFPKPKPPEPEKPMPPRRKIIRPLANIWIKPPRPRPSSTTQ